MQISKTDHQAGPWRIHEVVADFTLEDAWDLPVQGTADDFRAFVADVTAGNPSRTLSRPTRIHWRIRDVIGRFGLGRIATARAGGSGPGLPIPGTHDRSLTDRLPTDLRGTAASARFAHLPFTPVYQTPTEFVAEMGNRLVHGVMHLAWVDTGDGHYRGRMGVYTKPRGTIGKIYMAFIKPFRLWIVYPALLRRFERTWQGHAPR